MLTAKRLSPGEIAIIIRICEERIESFLRLSHEPEVQKDLFQLGISVTQAEINKQIFSFIQSFDNIKVNPHKIAALEDTHLSLVKHSLFNMEEEFSGDLEKDRRRLWRKIICRDNFEKLIFLN